MQILLIRKPWWHTWWARTGYLIAALLGIYFFVTWRTRALKRKQKELKIKVAKATAEISEQHELLEESYKEITDSIAYAKRIQKAILPHQDLFIKSLPQSFILYKPKDVVAGGFYWLEVSKSSEPFGSAQGPQEQELKETVLLAVADCTGHGVPGAMVSVVCNNALNRSVIESGLTDPGKILNEARRVVLEEFGKSDDEVKDGMDIALLSLEQEHTAGESVAHNSCSTLKYAGAHNPVWIIRENQDSEEEIKASCKANTPEKLFVSINDEYTLIEIKADKQPIGKYHAPQSFQTHQIDLKKGDTVYIFSDGYADQFGGEKGKKLKTGNFKKLLLSIQDKSLEDQRNILEESFEEWRGDNEQIDDVCVIGFKI